MEDTPCVPRLFVKGLEAADVQEDRPVSQENAPEIEEPYWEIEKIVRWQEVKKNKKIIKEYLILWKGFPAEEATWITPEQLIRPELLQQFLREDKPVEEKL